MKTSTVNGVTYELEDGWEPIKSVPNGIVRFLFEDGMIQTGHLYQYCYPIAWQHIVAPKVMSWKPKSKEKYWYVSLACEVECESWWPDDAADRKRYSIGNCYPTESAAEAARERVIAAHNGGAKWKGGV